MEVHAPTLAKLNKPQKRALILRDQLRYTEAPHLDTFLEGIGREEPPAYKFINGTIQPALIMVTLKDSATRFDLGNVHFQTDIVLEPGIYHAYLTVENGRFEIRTEEALPEDESNLETVPIIAFIAKNMVPMFEAKFKAIFARMEQVNAVRQAAFNSVNKPVQQFQEGETLARFDADRSTKNGSSSQAQQPKQRSPGDAIPKHASNFRKRIGLETIPEDAKAATFDAIPEKVKVNLFDNIFKTALPNFDNLMMASWNVVSVYSNVGTDFPELHKSIVELKSVLQDFEEGIGKKIERKEPVLRRDFAEPPQDGASGAEGGSGFGGGNGAGGMGFGGAQDVNGSGGAHDRPMQSAPEPPQDAANDAAAPAPAQDEVTPPPQEHDSADDFDATIDAPVTATQNDDMDMPPPNIDLMQMIQRHDDTGEQDSENDSTPEPEPAPRASSKRSSIHRSNTPKQVEPRARTQPRLSSSSHSLAVSSPAPPPRRHTSTIPDFSSISIAKQISKPKSTRHTLPTITLPNLPFDDSPQNSRSNTPTTPASTIPKKRSLADLPTPELLSHYKKRKEDLVAAFKGHNNVPQQYRVQMQKMMAEIRLREERDKECGDGDEEGEDRYEEEGGRVLRGGKKMEMEKFGGGKKEEKVKVKVAEPKFLGNSVLGGKKSGGGLGSAPVAPMMHVRRKSGGGEE